MAKKTDLDDNPKLRRINKAKFMPCAICNNPMIGIRSFELKPICDPCDIERDKPDGDKCT